MVFPAALPVTRRPALLAIFLELPLDTAEKSPSNLASQYKNPLVLLTLIVDLLSISVYQGCLSYEVLV